jgi:hypothetical protein
MARSLVRTFALSLALVTVGWILGHAQASVPPPLPDPAFELLVTAPGGDISVQCIRGCAVREKPSVNNPVHLARPAQAEVGWACKQRCSLEVHGWIK